VILCGRTSTYLLASKDTFKTMADAKLVEHNTKTSKFALYRSSAEELDILADIADSQHSEEDRRYRLQAQKGNNLYYLKSSKIKVRDSVKTAEENLKVILTTFQSMTDTSMWNSWARQLFTNRGRTDDTVNTGVAVLTYCEFAGETFDILLPLFGKQLLYILTITSK
jgi:hypothetical protein